MRSRIAGRLVQGLVYAWTFPTTAPGLVVAALAAISRGRIARVAGTLEVHGDLVAGLLRRLPLRGGVAAVALGHVVLGESDEALSRHRAHERVHVRQAERWGPLFFPAYAAAAAWAWLRGGHPYRDNVFEREARERG